MSDHDEREDYDDERRPSVEAPEQLRSIAAAIAMLAVLQLLIALTILALVVLEGRLDRDVTVVFMLSLAIALNVIVAWGAGRLDRCQGYLICVGIVFLSMIALPCCVLAIVSIPLGICALIEMGSPEARYRFDIASARRVPGTGPQPDEIEP